MWKQLTVGALLAGLLLALATQRSSLSRMQAKLASAEQRLSELEENSSRRPRSSAQSTATLLAREPARIAGTDPQTEQRLLTLEQTVANLELDSRHLMDRGQLPPDAEFLAEMQRKFLDPATTDRDRLQALRVLRRGNGLDDAALQFTANWIQSMPDDRLREETLRNLQGMTNAVLQAPFMQLAAQSQDARVRERAVENLRRYVGDPQVETLLWDRMRNDPERRVRETASEALREGPLTEPRIVAFKQIALNAQLPMDERLFAISALRSGRVDAPEVTATIAQLAQSGQEPGVRMRVFQAFDGTTDTAFVAPFVQGLQDPNPAVRRQAADSLSGLKADPNVTQWLQYVAQNDTDPQVRREAQEALQARR